MSQMQGAWYVFLNLFPPLIYLCLQMLDSNVSMLSLLVSFNFYAGHFIQHCPTNGDPNYDIKRVKQPTGIPRSMLMVNPQGSYALPNGSVAVLKPNE